MFIEMLAEDYGLIHENNMRLEYKGKITKVEMYEGGTDENLPHWVRIKVYKNNSENNVMIPFVPEMKLANMKKISNKNKDIKSEDIDCAIGFCVFASDEIEDSFTDADKTTRNNIELANRAFNKASDNLKKRCIKVGKGLEDYDNVKDEIEEAKRKYERS